MAGPGKGYISKTDPRRKKWEALQETSAGGGYYSDGVVPTTPPASPTTYGSGSSPAAPSPVAALKSIRAKRAKTQSSSATPVSAATSIAGKLDDPFDIPTPGTATSKKELVKKAAKTLAESRQKKASAGTRSLVEKMAPEAVDPYSLPSDMGMNDLSDPDSWAEDAQKAAQQAKRKQAKKRSARDFRQSVSISSLAHTLLPKLATVKDEEALRNVITDQLPYRTPLLEGPQKPGVQEGGIPEDVRNELPELDAPKKPKKKPKKKPGVQEGVIPEDVKDQLPELRTPGLKDLKAAYPDAKVKKKSIANEMFKTALPKQKDYDHLAGAISPKLYEQSGNEYNPWDALPEDATVKQIRKLARKLATTGQLVPKNEKPGKLEAAAAGFSGIESFKSVGEKLAATVGELASGDFSNTMFANGPSGGVLGGGEHAFTSTEQLDVAAAIPVFGWGVKLGKLAVLGVQAQRGVAQIGGRSIGPVLENGKIVMKETIPKKSRVFLAGPATPEVTTKGGVLRQMWDRADDAATHGIFGRTKAGGAGTTWYQTGGRRGGQAAKEALKKSKRGKQLGNIRRAMNTKKARYAKTIGAGMIFGVPAATQDLGPFWEGGIQGTKDDFGQTMNSTAKGLISMFTAPLAITANVALSTKRLYHMMDGASEGESWKHAISPAKRVGEELLGEGKHFVDVYTSKDVDEIARATQEEYGLLNMLGAYWLARPLTRRARGATSAAVDRVPIGDRTIGDLRHDFRQRHNASGSIGRRGGEEQAMMAALTKDINRLIQRMNPSMVNRSGSKRSVAEVLADYNKAEAESTANLPKNAKGKVEMTIADVMVWVATKSHRPRNIGEQVGETAVNAPPSTVDSVMANVIGDMPELHGAVRSPQEGGYSGVTTRVGELFWDGVYQIRRNYEAIRVQRRQDAIARGETPDLHNNAEKMEPVVTAEQITGEPSGIERPEITADQAKADIEAATQAELQALQAKQQSLNNKKQNLNRKERVKLRELELQEWRRQRQSAKDKYDDGLDEEPKLDEPEDVLFMDDAPVAPDTPAAELRKETQYDDDAPVPDDPNAPAAPSKLPPLDDDAQSAAMSKGLNDQLDWIKANDKTTPAPDSKSRWPGTTQAKIHNQARLNDVPIEKSDGNWRRNVDIREDLLRKGVGVDEATRRAAVGENKATGPKEDKWTRKLRAARKNYKKAKDEFREVSEKEPNNDLKINKARAKRNLYRTYFIDARKARRDAQTTPDHRLAGQQSKVDAEQKRIKAEQKQLDEELAVVQREAAKQRGDLAGTENEQILQMTAEENADRLTQSRINAYESLPDESRRYIDEIEADHQALVERANKMRLPEIEGEARPAINVKIDEEIQANRTRTDLLMDEELYNEGLPASDRTIEQSIARDEVLEAEAQALIRERQTLKGLPNKPVVRRKRREIDKRLSDIKKLRDINSVAIASKLDLATVKARRAVQRQRNREAYFGKIEEAHQREFDYQVEQIRKEHDLAQGIYIRHAEEEGDVLESRGMGGGAAGFGNKREQFRTGEAARKGDVDRSMAALQSNYAAHARSMRNRNISAHAIANATFHTYILGRGNQRSFTEAEIAYLKAVDPKFREKRGRFYKVRSRVLDDPVRTGDLLGSKIDGDHQKFFDNRGEVAYREDAQGIGGEDALAQKLAAEGGGDRYYLVEKAYMDRMIKQERDLNGWDKLFSGMNTLQSRTLLGMSVSWALAQPIAEFLVLWADHPNLAKIYSAWQRERDIMRDPTSPAAQQLSYISGAPLGLDPVTKQLKDRQKETSAGVKAFKRTLGHQLLVNGMTLRTLGTIDRWKGAHIRRTGTLLEIDREVSHIRRVSKAAKGLVDEVEQVAGLLKNLDDTGRLAYLNSPEGMAAGRRITRNIDASLGNWLDLSPVEKHISGLTIFYPFIRFSLNWSLRTFPKRHPVRWQIGQMLGTFNAQIMERYQGDDVAFMSEYAAIPIYGNDEGPPTGWFPISRYNTAGNVLLEALGNDEINPITLTKVLTPAIGIGVGVSQGRDEYGNPLEGRGYNTGDYTFGDALREIVDRTTDLAYPAREFKRSIGNVRFNDQGKTKYDHSLIGPFSFNTRGRKPRVGDDPNKARAAAYRIGGPAGLMPWFFEGEGSVTPPAEFDKAKRRYNSLYQRRAEAIAIAGQDYTEKQKSARKRLEDHDSDVTKRKELGTIRPNTNADTRATEKRQRIMNTKGYAAWQKRMEEKAQAQDVADKLTVKLDQLSKLANVPLKKTDDQADMLFDRSPAGKRKKAEDWSKFESTKNFTTPGEARAVEEGKIPRKAKNPPERDEYRYVTPGNTPGQKKKSAASTATLNKALRSLATVQSPAAFNKALDVLPELKTKKPDEVEKTIVESKVIKPKAKPTLKPKQQIQLARRIRKVKAEVIASGGKYTITGDALNKDQEKFAAALTEKTGLDPQTIGAWLVAEQGGPPGDEYSARGYYNFLNIGPHSTDTAFNGMDSAVDATAELINTSGHYEGIRATKGDDPATQAQAVLDSPWGTVQMPLDSVQTKQLSGKVDPKKKALMLRLMAKGKTEGIYETPEQANKKTAAKTLWVQPKKSLGPGKLIDESGGGLAGDTTEARRLGMTISKRVGKPLTIISGYRGGATVAGSGNVSNHASGNALDIHALSTRYGTAEDEAKGDRIAYEAVLAAGGSKEDAQSLVDGAEVVSFTSPNGAAVEVLWKTDQGGDHHDHVHVGIGDGLVTGPVFPNLSQPMSPMDRVKAEERMERILASSSIGGGGGTTGGGSTGGGGGTPDSAGEQARQSLRDRVGSDWTKWGTSDSSDVTDVSAAEGIAAASAIQSFGKLPKYKRLKVPTYR